jgi:hypothetical protein
VGAITMHAEHSFSARKSSFQPSFVSEYGVLCGVG